MVRVWCAKQAGTYVAPHERKAPNNANLDDYRTKGDVNWYTGQPGTKEPNPYGYQKSQSNQSTQTNQLGTLPQQLSTLQPPTIEPIKPLKF